jgi:hypothetical protein
MAECLWRAGGRSPWPLPPLEDLPHVMPLLDDESMCHDSVSGGINIAPYREYDEWVEGFCLLEYNAILEDRTLHNHHCENLKSYRVGWFDGWLVGRSVVLFVLSLRLEFWDKAVECFFFQSWIMRMLIRFPELACGHY